MARDTPLIATYFSVLMPPENPLGLSGVALVCRGVHVRTACERTLWQQFPGKPTEDQSEGMRSTEMEAQIFVGVSMGAMVGMDLHS